MLKMNDDLHPTRTLKKVTEEKQGMYSLPAGLNYEVSKLIREKEREGGREGGRESSQPQQTLVNSLILDTVHM